MGHDAVWSGAGSLGLKCCFARVGRAGRVRGWAKEGRQRAGWAGGKRAGRLGQEKEWEEGERFRPKRERMLS